MNAVISVLTQSLILGIMVLGIYISYKILDFPDMSSDSSFTTGASVATISIINGYNPVISIILAMISGCLSGLLTGILHVKFKISNLLSGILVMGMLYSINLRILGKSNVPIFNYDNIFTNNMLIKIIVIILLIKVSLDIFFKTNTGYLLKGVGDNPQMIKSLGVDIGNIKILGLMMSNSLVALSGSLMAQFQGFTDINMGVSSVVLGIASIIIGTTILSKLSKLKDTSKIIVGSIIYQFIIYLAINMGMLATDLKLTTSLVIVLFLSTSNLKINKKVIKTKNSKEGVLNVTN